MSEIIEHIDGGEKPVMVGDSNSPIPLRVYQDAYRQITGRTEQIRKRYSNNLLIEFPELEQLNYKILQLCDVHNVVAKNEVVSVFHEKDRKEQFTTFEKFRNYNSNAASPTVNLVLKYNFSIIPAGLERPQEYVVTIRLTSRVAALQQLEDEAPSFMRGRFMSYLDNETAEVTIDYVDYVVARGFLEAFDEWIRGCKTIPNKNWLEFLRRWSNLAPHIMRLGAIVLIAYYMLGLIPTFFSEPLGSEKGARFLIIFSAAIYIIISFAHAAGQIVEYVMDGYPILSYLKLNRGDSNLIDAFQNKTTKLIAKFVWASLVLPIILGLVVSKLDKLI